MPHASPAGRAPWRVLALDGVYAIRLGLFLLAVGTALRLLMPGSSVLSSPGYAWFAEIGPDEFWAGVVAAEAALHGLALASARRLWSDRLRQRVRGGTAILGAGFRMGMTYGLWMSNELTLGIVVHGVCAYLALWLVWRNYAAAPPARTDHA